MPLSDRTCAPSSRSLCLSATGHVQVLVKEQEEEGERARRLKTVEGKWREKRMKKKSR